MTSVLWYVHDVGSGHLRCAEAVLAHLRVPTVVAAGPRVDLATLASGPTVADVVSLPSDVPRASGADGWPMALGPGHRPSYAPGRRRSPRDRRASVHDRSRRRVRRGHRARSAARPARRHPAPVGRRDDEAHRIGFASADAYGSPSIRRSTPSKPTWSGGRRSPGAFSRFDRPGASTSDRCRRRVVTILVGAGGHHLPMRRMARRHGAAGVDRGHRRPRRTVGQRWHLLGRPHGCRTRSCARSAVVVTAAGWASVAGRRQLRCSPRRRRRTPAVSTSNSVRAESLAAAGLAVHLPSWPTPAQLPSVIDSTMALAPDTWAPYYDHRGAVRAAELVERVHGA